MLIWFVILFFLPLALGLVFTLPVLSTFGVFGLIGIVGLLKKAMHWR